MLSEADEEEPPIRGADEVRGGLLGLVASGSRLGERKSAGVGRETGREAGVFVRSGVEIIGPRTSPGNQEADRERPSRKEQDSDGGTSKLKLKRISRTALQKSCTLHI